MIIKVLLSPLMNKLFWWTQTKAALCVIPKASSKNKKRKS